MKISPLCSDRLLIYKSAVAGAAIYCIKFYQKTISPDHGLIKKITGRNRCRFFPSCSDYAIQSLRQYGLWQGTMLSLGRIVRCNPLGSGGYDPVR